MTKYKSSLNALEEQYETIPRLTQEKSDFLLPQVVDFIREKRWINLRPEYQRRLVWDKKKKSRFIESLLLNIPVPPVFLYEHELSRYEVMDGQQRLNTILEFYENRLKLAGLTKWPGLNNLRLCDCPEKISRGFDRRRISATVLLAESAETKDQVQTLRKDVFERLNTGGEKLNAQELRNALYGGPFNDLVIELAGLDLFDDVWQIPRYSTHYDRKSGKISDALRENALFRKMKDCEIVLRFFAFRNAENIRGSVRAALDRTAETYQDAPASTLADLRSRFVRSLEAAAQIFEKDVFTVPGPNDQRKQSEPLFDAVMVALDHTSDADIASLLRKKTAVQKALATDIRNEKHYEVLVGSPNTSKAVKARIALMHRIYRKSI